MRKLPGQALTTCEQLHFFLNEQEHMKYSLQESAGQPTTGPIIIDEQGYFDPVRVSDMTTEAESYTGASFTCKAILDRNEMPNSSREWNRAKKYTLTFEEDGLAYGSIFTPYTEIESATLHIYKSAFFFEYGILRIETPTGNHFFGIKYSDFWKGELPFTLEHKEEESPYILYRRILMIGIVVYIIWEIVKP